MAKLVALKGENGKYLECVQIGDKRYLKLSGKDRKQLATAHEYSRTDLGYLQIKSSGYYWKLADSRSPQPISLDSDARDEFEQILLSDDTPKIIALRHKGNGNVCTRYTGDNATYKDCLCADATEITCEAKLVMEPLP